MRKGRRLLALMLAFIMVVTMLPESVLASSAYNGTEGVVESSDFTTDTDIAYPDADISEISVQVCDDGCAHGTVFYEDCDGCALEDCTCGDCGESHAVCTCEDHSIESVDVSSDLVTPDGVAYDHEHNQNGWLYLKNPSEAHSYKNGKTVTWDPKTQHGKTPACTICKAGNVNNNVTVESHSFDQNGVCSGCGYDSNSGSGGSETDHAPKNVKVRLLGEEAGSDGTKYVVTEVSWDEDKEVGVCEMRPFVVDENGNAYEFLIKDDGQSIAREDDPGEVPKGFRYKVENGRNKFRLKVKTRQTGEAKTYTDSQGRPFSNGVGEGEDLLVCVQSNVGGQLSNLFDAPVIAKITDDNIKNKKVFTEEKDDPAKECDHNYTWVKMDDTFHEFKCTKCGDVHTTAPHAFRKVQTADGKGTDYICMICNYRFEEEEELKPEEKPVIKEVEWKSIEEGFDVSFVTQLKQYTSVEGIIGNLVVWGGDEASGEPIAESDIKKDDCTVWESTETTVTLKAPVEDTIWNVLLEELNKMDKVTVALKQKQEKVTQTGEKKTEDVLSEPVTVEKGKKKTQVEIQEECSHAQEYGRVYVSLDKEYHSRRCGKCLKELSADIHGSRKYVPENDKTHAWVCKQCGGVINSGIAHDITTEPCVDEDGEYDGFYTEKCETCGWKRDGEMECDHPEDKLVYKRLDSGFHKEICSQCNLTLNEKEAHLFDLEAKDAEKHTYTCTKCEETHDDDHTWGERMFTQIRSRRLGLHRDFKYREKCSLCGAYRTGWINVIVSWWWTRWYFDHEQLELAILEGKIPESWKNKSKYVENLTYAIGQTSSTLGILVPGMKLGEQYIDLDGRKVSLVAAASSIQFQSNRNEGGYYGKGMDFKVFDKSGNEITNKPSKDKIDNVQGFDAVFPDGNGNEEEWPTEDNFVDVSDVDGFIIAFNGETLKSVEDGSYTIEIIEVLEDPEDPSAEPVAVILPMSYTVATVNGEKCVTPLHPADMLIDNDGKTYEVNINSREFTYTGETINPVITVAGSEGAEFKEGTDYNLSYYKISENSGQTVLTPIDKSAVKDTGSYRVIATGISDSWEGSAYTDFTVTNPMTASISPVTLKQGEDTEPVISLGDGYFVTNVTYADANEAKKATAAGITVMTTGTDRDGVFCEVHVSADINAPVGTTDIKLRVEGESIDGKVGSAVATMSVTVEKGTGVIEPEASEWNLFEDGSAHEYGVGGVIAKKKLNNSNKDSSKYFDATLYKGKITVALKAGADRKKAAAANTFDFDLGESGGVSYTLPITYNKPVLKLSSAKGTVKKGKMTNLTTGVLVETENGNYVPFDLDGAAVTYGTNTVTVGTNGQITIAADAKTSGKIKIAKSSWNEKDAIELKYAIAEVRSDKDVLEVDLGGLKQVVLNSNAPEQTFAFPVLLNGEPAAADAVTLTVNKAEAASLGSIGAGVLNVSLGRSGLKKGSYTFTVASKNDTKAKAAVKVKISEKELAKAVTGKVKQKLDIVTGQPMVVEPNLKEISGTVTGVSVAVTTAGAAYTDFNAVMDGGNINVTYTGTKAMDAKNLKIGDMKFYLTVDGITDPVEFTLKNVSAKKTNPTAKGAKVVIPKDAAEKADGSTVIATANILSTYKDAAKHVKTITPVGVTLNLKNVTAEVDKGNNNRILIKKLDGKSGSVKATLTYPGGITKTVTISVAKGK